MITCGRRLIRKAMARAIVVVCKGRAKLGGDVRDDGQGLGESVWRLGRRRLRRSKRVGDTPTLGRPVNAVEQG